MIKQKTSRPYESNESKIPTDGNKREASKPKNFRGRKPRNKPSLEPGTETDFQGWCNDLEGYIFDIGTRASKTISRTMKEMEIYLGETYSDSCQPAITNDTTATFPDP